MNLAILIILWNFWQLKIVKCSSFSKMFLHEIIFLEKFHYLKIGWVTWVPYLHHELIAILKFEYCKNEMQKIN